MKRKNVNIFIAEILTRLLLTFLFVAYISAQGPHDSAKSNKGPNIVVIVADDLGWDDVSFHGSPQIPTPNIDALALSGVILNNYYVSPSSFATKCELMTGKYATRLGVQHGVMHNKQPIALPEMEKILPQYLKELGYKTHAIGKWSLGFYKENLLPWHRGFDSFYGGLTSSGSDYFTHSAYDENYGLDLRRNEEVVHNETGHYVTNLYTSEAVKVIKNHDQSKSLFLYVAHQAVHSGNADDPLQAPAEYVKKVDHIKSPKRKLFAGMVVALDESMQNITMALSSTNLLSNTIIIFSTSSGGAVGGMELNSASNFPLRGSKMTVWEGGIRGVAFVYSEKIQENSRVNEEMFHATDWLPTILGLAGGYSTKLNSLDGFDVWDVISHENIMSPRFEILHQFDPLQKNQCALRVGDYKLVINQDIGFYGDWYPRPAEVGELQDLTKPSILPNSRITCDKNYPHPFLEMHAPPCDPMRKPCLFNIQWDPCEFHNLAEFMPNTLKVLLDRLHFYHIRIVKPLYPKFDAKADPEFHDGVWGPWINMTKSFDVSNPLTFVSKLVTLTNAGQISINYTVTNSTLSIQPSLNQSQIMKVSTHPEFSNFTVITLPTAYTVPTLNISNPSASVASVSNLSTPFLYATPVLNVSNPYAYATPLPSISSSSAFPASISNLSNTSVSGDVDTRIAGVSKTTDLTRLLPAVADAPPQNYSISSAPKFRNDSVSGVGENVQNRQQHLDIKSNPGDHVDITVKNTNASRQIQQEIGNMVGDTVESGNVDIKLDTKGKTTHFDLRQNEKGNVPVETSATADEVQVDTSGNYSTSVITDGGISYTNTNTKLQQNVQGTAMDSGPVNAVNAIEVKEMGRYSNLPVSYVPLKGNDTTGQGSSSPAAGKPIGGNLQKQITAPSNIEPAPPPVPVVSEGHEENTPTPIKTETSEKQAPQTILHSEKDAVKAGSLLVSPYDLEQPIEPLQNSSVIPSSGFGLESIKPALHLPPAVPDHPHGASLRPDKSKQKESAHATDSGKSLELGTGTNTSVLHDANTFTSSKTDSKLPALQHPHIIASLSNLADAGKPGKSGMSSEVALITGESIGPAKGTKPVAEDFIKEPKYQNIVEPAFDKPQDPFKEFKSLASESNMSTGTSTSSGSETETETVVGAGASTSSGTKIKHKHKHGPKFVSPNSSTESEIAEKDNAKLAPSTLPIPAEESKEIPVVKAVNQGLPLGPATKELQSAKVVNQSIVPVAVPKGLPLIQAINRSLALDTSSEGFPLNSPTNKAAKAVNQSIALDTVSNELPVTKFFNQSLAHFSSPKELLVTKAINQGFPLNASIKELPVAEVANQSLGLDGFTEQPKVKPVTQTVTIDTLSKFINQSIGENIAPKLKLDSFLKPDKPNLGSSLKALSIHSPLDKGIDISLLTGQHNDLPNAAIAGQRTFQSVVDLVSDSSNPVCTNGRNCVTHNVEDTGMRKNPDISKEENILLSINEKPVETLGSFENVSTASTPTKQYTPTEGFKAFKQATSALEQDNELGTQATSNQSVGTIDAVKLNKPKIVTDEDILHQLPAQEKLHKFFGKIKVDNKKMFYISGTASEEKDIVITQASNLGRSNQNDVKKHNIGFNVMLPAEIKQITPIPKFKEHARIEGSNKTEKDHISLGKEGHPKTKSKIKKVFDMIADPARTRKMKVPEIPKGSEKNLVNKGNIATETNDQDQGDTGDIGATKPVKGGESKHTDISSNDSVSTAEGGKKSKALSNTEAGDLGSIVTLVGKVKVDRLSTKRTKHNSTKEVEKMDKIKSEHLKTVNRMSHNSSETNAANIDKLAGPSNSIIVSSVIVVLIASFVVVGMAVVAVVAVVARHCRLGKHMDAT